jgi:ELWxxDGT repeat protein
LTLALACGLAAPVGAQAVYRVKDINTRMVGSSPRDLAELGGSLYFQADSAGLGEELWRSDGTPAGTVLVEDICPGTCSPFTLEPSPSIYPSSFLVDLAGTLLFTADAALGTKVLFVADDGTTGSEPWALDTALAVAPLLRNTEVTAIDPPSPPLGSILPLDPVQDLYLDPFVSQSLTPTSRSSATRAGRSSSTGWTPP